MSSEANGGGCLFLDRQRTMIKTISTEERTKTALDPRQALDGLSHKKEVVRTLGQAEVFWLKQHLSSTSHKIAENACLRVSLLLPG